MVHRPLLIDPADLARSVPASESGPIDQGLMQWAIETVSGRALAITRRDWSSPEDVPYGVYPILNVAARRLYVNPDRYSREAEGDYSYGLDASMSSGSVFTPDEEASLREYAAGMARPQGIGTLGTYRGDGAEPRTVYVRDGSRTGFPWWDRGDML